MTLLVIPNIRTADSCRKGYWAGINKADSQGRFILDSLQLPEEPPG